MRLWSLLCWMLAAASQATAQGVAAVAPQVSLSGVLGGKALLVVGGAPPKALATGESHLGVKLLSIVKDTALVEQEGKQFSVRMGEGLIGGYVKPSALSRRIVLNAGSGGHFHTPGQINGQYVDFMVDTGASVVSMGASTAQALGLAYKSGRPIPAQTANGMVTGYLVLLDSVKVGDVVQYQVEAVVLPMSMGSLLLGNSFLSRFDIRQSNGQMVLESR